MSKDRFAELVEKRSDLLVQLSEVEAELREEVQGWNTAAAPRTAVRKPAPRPAARKPSTAAAATPTTAAATDADAAPGEDNAQGKNAEGNRQSSLKEVVQEILGRSDRGMELKEIVAEVTRMIQNGEYHSKAKKVTPVVSQALFQLKQERLVAVEKSPDNNRNLYSLSQSAA